MPPFVGIAPGTDRTAARRPAPAAGVPATPDAAIGAVGSGLSASRSTPGTVLAVTGTVTGPVAEGGAAAGRGGGGATTALRAAALISAIERVSG
jgi:hypothetical protein